MNEEGMILPIEFMDGETALRMVLAIFTAENKRSYAALLPLSENGIPIAGAEIELVRATPCKNERGEDDYEISSIASAMEYDIAVNAFESTDFTRPEIPEDLDEDDTPLPSVFLENDDGTEAEWKVIDLFYVEDGLYAALTPVEPDSYGRRPDIDISLFRAEKTVQNGQGGIVVSDIETDEEFEKVREVFENRLTIDF